MSSWKALDLRTDSPPWQLPPGLPVCVVSSHHSLPPEAAVALPVTFRHSEDCLQRNSESPASD